ncbi:MAG TPA: energy transducer TonB [Burkholderiales bacterium]|nr:energy transducer TonB [Burkholderiales bacterium]
MWSSRAAAEWSRDDKQERTLYLCFGFSIALHTFVMLAFPGLQAGNSREESRVLTAMFESRTEPAESRAPVPVRNKVRERREIPVALEQTQSPAPTAALRVEERVPDPAPPSAQPFASAEAPRVSEPDSTVAARPPAELSDAGLLEAYRLALIDAAKRYKRYPVQAMERGWEGRVEIRVVVDANGAIKNALVKTSSRYQILDAQALDMVKRAFNALTQVRPAPRGREFTVDVPVIFELQTG